MSLLSILDIIIYLLGVIIIILILTLIVLLILKSNRKKSEEKSDEKKKETSKKVDEPEKYHENCTYYSSQELQMSPSIRLASERSKLDTKVLSIIKENSEKSSKTKDKK